MFTSNRLQRMSEWIQARRNVSVQELIERYQVSDMTIRRDLQKLEENNLGFKRIHGGVIWNETDIPFILRENDHTVEKQQIAAYCQSIIQSGDTIILDSGTTTYEIAVALAEANMRDITVITYALNVAHRLRNVDHISLLMPGGEFRRGTQSFVGSTAMRFFETIYAAKVFVSTSGVTSEAGFTNANFAEVEIKQALSRASESVYYVTDSSKFGQRSPYIFAPLASGTKIITDQNLDDDWTCKLEALHADLVKV
ncbi:MAG: DeoR/GlpR family DNA-binding transcription regulator [Bacilli bacterium]